MFSLTEDDSVFLNEASASLGFRSRSQLVTAIMERLIVGGFSLASFIKLGAQFSKILPEAPLSAANLFDAIRPFPPLIGDQPEPKESELVPILKVAQRQFSAK